MKARIKKGIAAGAAVVCAAAAVVFGTAGNSAAQPSGLRAYAISTDGTLMATFATDRPQQLDWVRLIAGLAPGEIAIGIDYRVQDGLMYLVGSLGNIYTVKLPDTPAQDPVVTKVSRLTIQLYGSNFGVDFNPAADRLRVISDNGQNLRHNLNDHTTTEDAILTTPPTQAPTRGVTAGAYTNNDLNLDTVTTLFTIGTLTDQVLIQSPANEGKLAPTGALGVDTGISVGFDIFSDLTNGKTTSSTGFAILTPTTGGTVFYTVNLLTGATTMVGRLPLPFTDLTIALDTN